MWSRSISANTRISSRKTRSRKYGHCLFWLESLQRALLQCPPSCLSYVITLYLIFVTHFFTPVMLLIFVAIKPAQVALKRLSNPRPSGRLLVTRFGRAGSQRSALCTIVCSAITLCWGSSLTRCYGRFSQLSGDSLCWCKSFSSLSGRVAYT